MAEVQAASQRTRGKWLPRDAIATPYFKLCLSEQDFLHEMRVLNVQSHPQWVAVGYSGRAHHFESDGRRLSIVCMDGWQGKDPVEVAGLIVHEAVHIWQEMVEHMNERDPSREFEAYSIQHIAQQLMLSFRDQVKAHG